MTFLKSVMFFISLANTLSFFTSRQRWDHLCMQTINVQQLIRIVGECVHWGYGLNGWYLILLVHQEWVGVRRKGAECIMKAWPQGNLVKHTGRQAAANPSVVPVLSLCINEDWKNWGWWRQRFCRLFHTGFMVRFESRKELWFPNKSHQCLGQEHGSIRNGRNKEIPHKPDR